MIMDLTNISPVWIPIAAILFACAVACLGIYHKMQKEHMEHERRMKELEIEKLKLQQSQDKPGSTVKIP